jgi:hypothetical protein
MLSRDAITAYGPGLRCLGLRSQYTPAVARRCAKIRSVALGHAGSGIRSCRTLAMAATVVSNTVGSWPDGWPASSYKR